MLNFFTSLLTLSLFFSLMSLKSNGVGGCVYYYYSFIIIIIIMFFYNFFFLSIWVSFTNIHKALDRRGRDGGRGHFFNSSLPLQPASQTLRHQLGDYCTELTSAHSQQPDSNREPLVSERKSLPTKLRTLNTNTNVYKHL